MAFLFCQRGDILDSFIRILKYMKGYKFKYFLGMLSFVVSQFSVVSGPILIKIAIDNVLGNIPFESKNHEVFANFFGGVGYLKENLWVIGLLIFGLYLVRGIFSYFRMYLCPMAAEQVMKNMRERMYDSIQRLPYSYHSRVETGDLIQRCTSDIETIRRFLAQQLPDVLNAFCMIILSVYMMLSMNLKLAFLSTAILPLTFGFAIYFFKIIQKKFSEYEKAESVLTVNLQETMSGIRVVKAFAMQEYEIERFDKNNSELRRLDYDLLMQFANYWTISDFLSYLQIAFVVILGTYFAYNGEITVGTMVAFISYVNTMIWPVRQAGRLLTDMGKTSVSLNRIEKILEEKQENLYENGNVFEIEGNIKFENVTFKYDDGEENVFEDISFEIEKGKTLALIGPTGSGKSSMVHLLARLHEYNSGSIKIDGVELKEIDKGLIRKNVGLILQEPYLFAKSIRENVKLADYDISDEKMYEATRISAIHDDIMRFDKHYDTMVGEKGVSLSGGQKQRIAIARTIINNSPILIFDDSLSAVDTETDIAIRNALGNRKNDSTTIIISHRISTVMEADLILVLDNGRIVQRGVHETLLNEEGMYRRIYDIQNAQLEELVEEVPYGKQAI